MKRTIRNLYMHPFSPTGKCTHFHQRENVDSKSLEVHSPALKRTHQVEDFEKVHLLPPPKKKQTSRTNSRKYQEFGSTFDFGRCFCSLFSSWGYDPIVADRHHLSHADNGENVKCLDLSYMKVEIVTYEFGFKKKVSHQVAKLPSVT